MPQVQRFYVIIPSLKVLQHASFVYDRHTDGTWTVIKDRVNDQYNQILPSDEYLFMMILSAKPSKDWDYDLC